jgi:putative acetyltransferase
VIRVARPADAPASAALLRTAFGGEAEAALVAALREAGDVAIELVAQAPEGAILGHVLLSPMTVGVQAALALAPLAVAPAAQRQGIGTTLVLQALDLARGRPEAWCLVLGDPSYYGRFGFDAAAATGVSGLPWAGHAAFQALAMRADAPALRGPGRYACAFGLASPESAP